MYVNAPQTDLFGDDDLFTRPPRAVARQQQATTVRITCRACNGRPLVALDNDVLLCPDCRADLAKTRAWVLRDIKAIQVKELAALATFDALRIFHSSFWAKLDGRPAGTDDRARAAHPTYALLLDAEAAYLASLTPLAAERSRLEAALALIDSL